MVQKTADTGRLFPRQRANIPEWMAIRDADIKRRNDNQAKLRAARLARDANQTAGATGGASGSSRGKRVRKKKTIP
ncbi:MAG: hypothetical protein L0210_14065 [Rhodospirillales bacterium]|nr:hypothetical protein [Rhodospirillales bacterium]